MGESVLSMSGTLEVLLLDQVVVSSSTKSDSSAELSERLDRALVTVAFEVGKVKDEVFVELENCGPAGVGGGKFFVDRYDSAELAEVF